MSEQLNTTETVDTSTQDSAQAPQITDLDGLSKFSFQGREYTPDELIKIVNGYQSYSEKVQTLSKDQEFLDNLDADIDHVLKNPALADKFKATYPQKFHAILDRVLKTNRTEPASPNAAPPALPPQVLEKLSALEGEVGSFREERRQMAIEKATAEIDRITTPLFQKYPLADEQGVWARAEMATARGEKLTEKTWERFIRENHEAVQKRWDQTEGARLKEQTDKGRRAQDMGPGGSTPGQAPKGPRTMAEAREAAMAAAGV